MKINKSLVISALALNLVSGVSFAETSYFKKVPEGWMSEVMPMPIPFAPEIDLQGTLELRFPNGAFESGHANFWSYTFVWAVSNKVHLSEDYLQDSLVSYYRGLYRAITRKEKGGEEFKVSAEKTSQSVNKLADNNFKVEIQWHEPRSKEPMTLNGLVGSWKCPGNSETIIQFMVSPQINSHAIWKEMKALNVECRKGGSGKHLQSEEST